MKQKVRTRTTGGSTRAEATLGRLAQQIKREHEAVEQKTRESLNYARRAGELLHRVKAQLKHGEFMKWRDKHCAFSHATALLYMKIADNWSTLMRAMKESAKSEQVTNLTLRGAADLLRAKDDGEDEEVEPQPPRHADQVLNEIRRFLIALERAGEMRDHLRSNAEQIRQRLNDVRVAITSLDKVLTAATVAAA